MIKYGDFNEDGKEFIITERNIPRHWYNYMWNDEYITFCSHVGSGEGFAQDNLGRRISVAAGRNIYRANRNILR